VRHLGSVAWVMPRFPGAMPWTKCGGEHHTRKAVIAPIFVSTALASVVLAAIIYVICQGPALSAGPEVSSNGSVVVLGISSTTRATGAGTVVEVSGEHVRILTAKHLAVYGGLTVRLNSETTVAARVLTLIAGHDVAVIEAIVPARVASQLHSARIGEAKQAEHVTIGGSQADGRPDAEAASVIQTGGNLPDGAANGRFELSCSLCHPGDSGAGVFDGAGNLVGVYVGFWTYDDGQRVSIAEFPSGGTQAARVP